MLPVLSDSRISLYADPHCAGDIGSWGLRPGTRSYDLPNRQTDPSTIFTST